MIKAIKLLNLINKLSRNPSDTTKVFDIVDFLIKTRSKQAIKNIEVKLNQNKDFISFKKTHLKTSLTDPFDLNLLSKYSNNSLGYKLYKHYQNNNIDPAFYDKLEEKNDLIIIRNYLAKTHDLWHLITGFGNTPYEEYGLQAFYLGQEPSLAAFSIMSAGFLDVLKSSNPKKIPQLMDQITTGWEEGKKACNLLYIDWNKYLDTSLERVKDRFNLNQN